MMAPMTENRTSPPDDASGAVPEETYPSRPPRRRRGLWVGGAVGGVVLIGLVVFVLVVLQPQKLFIDDKVDEALPGLVVAGAAAPPEQTGTQTPVGQEPVATTQAPPADPLEAGLAEAQRTGAPVAVSSGTFSSLDHPASGQAYLVVLPDGSRLLRIEDLDTDNGPDLRVVLSTAEVGTGSYDDLVELGRLKGNIGSQNYEIPADLDLSGTRSVVIWCERFSSAFGEAPTVVGT